MQILRGGGEYLTARLRQGWLWLAATMLTGVVVAMAIGAWFHPLFGFLVLLGTVLLLHPLRARWVAPVRKGIRGETLVTDLLRGLPDGFYLVNDVTLPQHRGNIDHVVIGPCGVVVIETKHYAGTVRVFRDTWYVNGRALPHVSDQADRGAIAVRKFLLAQHPELHQSALRFVDAVVVFTNPLCRLKVRQPRASTVVVRYSQLLDVIREKARHRKIPDGQVRPLVQTLAVYLAHLGQT